MRRPGEIGDHGCAGESGHDVEDVLMRAAVAAKALRIGIVADFENVSANVGGVGGEERFDVVAVDGEPAIESELLADRLRAAETSEADTFRKYPPPRGRACQAGRPQARDFQESAG